LTRYAESGGRFFLMSLRAGLCEGEPDRSEVGETSNFGEIAEDSKPIHTRSAKLVAWPVHDPQRAKKSPFAFDLSKQLRGVLMDLRDTRLLAAMMNGKNQHRG